MLVSAPGPKHVGGSGLAGDDVFDLRHHGGNDQAVYAYAREDLDRWAAEFGHPVSSGGFGENLTTVGVDIGRTIVGERWAIGDTLLLEVSDPRIPCRTFAGFLGERGWIKRFTARAESGTYLRVLSRTGQRRRRDPGAAPTRPRRDRRHRVPGLHHRVGPAGETG